MDIKAYISSGILESYALGATNAQETAEVEANILAFPELALELTLIQNDLEKYAELHAQSPPSDLKERTRKAIFEQGQSQGTQTFEIKADPYRYSKKYNWKVAASWVILVLSLGANYYLFHSWQQSNEAYKVAQADNLKKAKVDAQTLSDYQNQLAILQSVDFKKIILKGTPDAPNAIASVYFNPQSNDVYLMASQMPKLPTGKQYQLWAIIDGKPVDAGMVNEVNAFSKMKLSPKATAFAISLENTGGSTTEAGPKGAVLVMGAV